MTNVRGAMLCPMCHEELKMMDRQGVEIDYCPRCRGVWLDRGELDKIIDRTAQFSGERTQEYPPVRPRMEEDYRDYDREREYEHRHRKKRGGFLGDLFDFD